MQLSWDSLEPYTALIKTMEVEPRAYQINIVKSVFSGRNSLVVLPTGLGKTLIAAFAIAKALYNGKKALILAPTKPLSEQHQRYMMHLLDIEQSNIALFTGALGTKKRTALLGSSRVIAATPQTIANDLEAGRMTLDEFGAVIFDECHRSVGRYAYTYIAEECKQHGVQLIGLTASPGSNTKKISALIETLGVKNIEIRLSTDADVSPYVMEKDTQTLYFDKGPIITAILALLKPIIEKHLEVLRSYGLSPFVSADYLPKGRLLQIGDAISKLQAPKYKFMAMAEYVRILHLSHAYDLASTEGIYPFLHYMDSLAKREKKSRAVIAILADYDVREAIRIAERAASEGIEHPKMLGVIDLVKNKFGKSSIIIFAQYRSTIKKIAELLNQNNITAKQFTGKREGFTQEMQKATIQEFREGAFRVLVASSIGEEGLDIPSVDAVVFYEPIPSEIRSIQRKGRAGRMKFGSIVMLVTRDTKDEKYLMIAHVREARMAEIVRRVQRQIEQGTYGKRSRKQKEGQQKLG